VGGCGVDGQACVDSSQCCSRECVPTIYGAFACQVAAGCRVEGDVCRMDSDCCSGRLPNPFPGACELDMTLTPPIGRCRQPPGNICQGTPEGNVCGGAPGGDGGQSARQDCCDCIPPKFNCCKPDLAGVLRCFGGSTQPCPTGYTGVPPCCIAAGGQCRFSAECCNGEPCVPDSNGVLRCGTMCVASGGVCTSTSDCCGGLTCTIPPGSPTGICGGAPPPPDGGVGDGAAGDGPPPPPDAPMCVLAGQMCSPTQACCAPLVCTGLSTGLACQPGQVCSCVIP